MQHLQEHAIHCVGIGKIWNIFNGAGVDESIETENNQDGFIKCIESLNKYKSGFLFLNLIDFDMLYGHRRDVVGYAQALIEFDQFLHKLLAALQPNDLVLISSDHGNDPTYPGTDHTREYVPLLVYSKLFQATNLGIRKSFADIGQTIGHAFTGNANILKIGNSFLNELKEHNRK
jgi:phosphopentomutase